MSIALRRDPLAILQRPLAGEVLARLEDLARMLAGGMQLGNGNEAPEASNRHLLVLLFTDIVGSTGLAERLGDDAWATVLARHHAICRQEVSRFGGREIDDAGDGFFIAFDRPGRALACAAAIRSQVPPIGLTIRAGVHSGECDVTNGKVTGLAVHVAARVCGMAEPDEILVSETVRDLVAGSEFRFLDRDWCRLKGLSEPRHLFALASRRPATIVGDALELPCASTVSLG